MPGFAEPMLLRSTVSDHATFRQCVVRNQYELSAFPQACELQSSCAAQVQLGQRPLIKDCRANIGLSVLHFAARFPAALICAVEPDEANFAPLKRNTANLGDRAMALQGGIWNRSTSLRISNPGAGSAAFQVSDASRLAGLARA